MVELSPPSRPRQFAGCYHQLLPVVRSRLKGTNGDDLYIRIATVGNTILTVNPPIYEYVSTPGNAAKLLEPHTVQCSPYLIRIKPTIH